MAETRRVSSAPPSTAPRRAAQRPRLPHPPSHKAPVRPPLDETHNLRPPVRNEEPPPPIPRPPTPRPRAARPIALGTPPRSLTERAILAVLVLGLILNALALLRHAALSRADVLLGATVLLSGVALLVLMEVYRRTGR